MGMFNTGAIKFTNQLGVAGKTRAAMSKVISDRVLSMNANLVRLNPKNLRQVTT
jgi:hypothetical protein